MINKKFSKKKVFVWSFVLFVMAAIAIGDVDPNSLSTGEGASETVAAGNKIQTINFRKNASLREALAFLAGNYHRNITQINRGCKHCRNNHIVLLIIWRV